MKWAAFGDGSPRDLLDRLQTYLRTRRGAATATLFVLIALPVAAAASSATGLVVGLGIAGFAGWGVVYVAARAWEQRTAPRTPRFALRSSAASVRKQLREDPNARVWIDRGGFLWAQRYWFTATGCPPVRITRGRYIGMLADRKRNRVAPVVAAAGRQWWWWDDTYYWASPEYDADDVKALIFQWDRRKERQLEHAKTVMALEGEADRKGRQPIPEDVKRLVHRRDGGRCQKCGSAELLQFDHILPLAMGGSNEPENLQLLCATCNREKGGVL